MRILKVCWLMAIVFLGTLAGTTQAGPLISYTESATVSGTIDGHAFTDALLVITGSDGDPASVVAAPNPVDPFIPFFYTNSSATTTFSLTGFGSGSFTGATFWFSNQDFFVDPTTGAGGFAVSGAGTVLATLSNAFTDDDYRLAITYGPIGGSPFFRDDVDFATSLGLLRISAAGSATFEAVLTTPTTLPEPGSLALLSISVLALLAARRRRSST